MNDDELRALYPFLHGGTQDAAKLTAALLGSIADTARESRETSAAFFAASGPALLAAARGVADVYRRGGRLFCMGNGGSSCDAAHVAVEFSHPVTTGRPALTAINLTADVAMLSAVANDVGFDQIFARQLGAQARAGDGLVGLSTSGSSANLLVAFARAREMGVTTIGFTGGDGGKMKASATLDHCLVVPSSSVHRVQECHVAAYHVLWDLVHTLLADDRGSARGAALGGRSAE
jgi:D-sedoheptulose 7-phosphate isomerase